MVAESRPSSTCAARAGLSRRPSVRRRSTQPRPRSEGGENQRRSLVGLREVAVVVEALQDESVRDGLSTQDIRTYVELRLRQSGISIPTVPTGIGGAWLYINVNVQKRTDIALYAVNVHVSLNQDVILLRDPMTTVFGIPTWWREGVFTTGSSLLREGTRRSVRDLVDEFLNDYLAANPKR
jgi:hypothetical protein